MTSTLRTGRLAPILLLLALVVGAAPAQATSAKIQAFFGKWEGNAVSESRISVNFQLTVRDINVEVGPSGGGFLLTWRTVQRQKGSPSDPKEVLRETTLDFQPVRAGIWRAGDSRDPLVDKGAYAWAFIDDQTLVVNVMRIGTDGRPELQVYRRTLTGGFMKLEFTRIVDGSAVRSAKGRLIKVSG